MYLRFQRFSIDIRTQQHWMKQQINTRRNLWNRKFEILALRYKLGIKEIPEKWSKIRRWMKMIVEFWWLLDIGGSWEMTLCKEEGPRHPIFFTMNKFKPQSLISSVLFGRVLLHRPRHFQLMELQSSSISGNPTSLMYAIWTFVNFHVPILLNHLCFFKYLVFSYSHQGP